MKEGWTATTLGNVLQLEYGKPLDPADRDPNGLYPAYGANGVKDRTNKFYRDRQSIIVGRKGSAGELTLTEAKYWPLDVTYFVDYDRQRHDLQFLYYLLDSLNLTRLAKGVKPGINRNEVYALRVLVPSLAEEQRIGGVLSDASNNIATAQANVDRCLQRAEDLGRALEEACFDQHVDSAFEPKQLADLCELIVDCEHKTAPTQEAGYPSIRTPNIGRGVLILGDVNRVSEETYQAWTRRAEPQPGDLILAREAPAGNIAIIPEGLKVCLGQRTVLIRPKADIFMPQYLAHLLLQRRSQQRLLAHSRGATVEHINMKDIRAFKISHVPSLDVQRQAIDKLTDIDDQWQALARAQTQKLAALGELRSALLYRAFNGDL